jgi:hypothetical protein
MKIRQGFVSNSSSTSYTVLVDPNYTATETEVDKASYDLDIHEIRRRNSVKTVNDILDLLRKGENLWAEEYCYQKDVGEEYWAVTELPGVHVLSSVNVSSDCGQLTGVELSKLRNIISHMSP